MRKKGFANGLTENIDIGVRKFDPQNELHKKLSQASKNLHELKAKNELDKIPGLEAHKDDLVRRLFGLKDYGK